MNKTTTWGIIFTFGVLTFSFTGCAHPESLERTQPAPAFQSLEAFESALERALESGDIDPFWEEIVAAGQMPLIFDQTVVFLYRGEAQAVAWGLDFAPGNLWLEYMCGERQGETDLWLLERHFPRDTRLSYRVILDGEQKILDPLNPYQSMEGSGPVSELRMTAYIPPQAIIPREDIVHGQLSGDLTILSQALHYKVNYRVYTPAGYEDIEGLPSIYVVDGQEYAHNDLGSMVTVLDNLIADGAIRPLIAVFIDQRDPYTGSNRRDDEFTSPRYVQFLVEELLPTIDAAYRCEPAPGSRAILGASLGGIFATRVGIAYPEVFGLVGLQSPAPSYSPEDYAALSEAGGALPLRFFITVGTIGDISIPARTLRNTLEAAGYPYQYIETNDGHAWGNYRGTLDELLIYFFGK